MPKSPPPTLGPPAVRVIRLTDFEAASAVFNNWNGRLEQISSGSFSGTLRIVQGRLIRIMGIEANQRVRLRGHDVAVFFLPSQ